MPSEPFPARLHVLMARDSLRSVVIRKGPANHVGFFEWDRGNDFVSVGQWLVGRIYERRADISPNGNHLIYFASKQQNLASDQPTCWTAVSRTPYLKALAFYPQESTWLGGGLFVDNQSYAARVTSTAEYDTSHLRKVVAPFNHKLGNAECLGVYFIRLERDGWTCAGRQDRPRSGDVDNGYRGSVTEFSKTFGDRWTLIKHCNADIDHPEGTGVYWDEHQLVDPAGDVQPLEGMRWADIDRGDLVFAKDGLLCRRKFEGKASLGAAKVIFDFNSEKLQRLQASY